MFKKINKKSIEFWPLNDDAEGLVSPPIPANKLVAEWYKKIPRYADGGNKLVISENGATNLGVKACTSFLDIFLTGYIFVTHCDILVTRDDHNKEAFGMQWTSTIPPLSSRPAHVADQIPPLSGYSRFLQAWELRYGFHLPKGYSVLITQPFNRFDLPTYSTAGIIDADDYLGPGGIPFALKDGFSGVIPKGTPMVQMIPFKRDSWYSTIIETPFPNKYQYAARDKLFGWYRENIWKKKEFL